MTDTTPTPAEGRPTPAVPDALLGRWILDSAYVPLSDRSSFMAHAAANWAWHQRDEEVRQARQEGANAELNACCEWLSGCGCESYGRELRAARRPPAPTLRERALDIIDRAEDGWDPQPEDWALMREALREGVDG